MPTARNVCKAPLLQQPCRCRGLQPASGWGRAALQPLHMQPASHPSVHRWAPCKEIAAGSACSQLPCRLGHLGMFRVSLQKAALQLLGVHAVCVIVLRCLPHIVLNSLIEGLHIVLVLSTQDLSKGSLQARWGEVRAGWAGMHTVPIAANAGPLLKRPTCRRAPHDMLVRAGLPQPTPAGRSELPARVWQVWAWMALVVRAQACCPSICRQAESAHKPACAGGARLASSLGSSPQSRCYCCA